MTPATAADVLEVAARLSLADEAQLHALMGLTPRDTLLFLHSQSPEVAIGRAPGGAPAFLLGAVADEGGDMADVWPIAVWPVLEPVEDHRAAVLAELARLSAIYGVLHGLVDARNRRARAWLRSLGFDTTHALLAYGPERRTFYEYAGSF